MVEPTIADMVDYHTVPKGWGREIWITNNELYCGKILEFRPGKKLSWHFHRIKDEVLFVESGSIIFRFSDSDKLESAEQVVLSKGQSVRIRPGLRHQFEALEESRLFEFSTQHFDDDSVRVIKGD